jgi:hypothetical protein
MFTKVLIVHLNKQKNVERKGHIKIRKRLKCYFLNQFINISESSYFKRVGKHYLLATNSVDMGL